MRMRAFLELLDPCEVHKARELSFEDTDPEVDRLGGEVKIKTAADESDIEFYSLHLILSALPELLR